MIAEDILTSYSIDALCMLMIEKIQAIKQIDRLNSREAYFEAREEIKLLQEAIKRKQAMAGEWQS